MGDLLFFKGEVGHYNKEFPEGIGHVAMFIRDGKIIHAKSTVKKVIEEKASIKIKIKDLVVVKRIL